MSAAPARELMSVEELAAVVSKRVPLKKIGRDRWGLCPFHHEKSPSFSVYEGKDGGGRYHCFGCGADGSAIAWLMKIEGKTFREAGGRSLDRRAVEQRDRERDAQRRRESVLGAYHDRWPDCCCPEWLMDTGDKP
jgi:DNA primase